MKNKNQQFENHKLGGHSIVLFNTVATYDYRTSHDRIRTTDLGVRSL